MSAALERRLEALEGHAGTVTAEADAVEHAEAWGRLLKALRDGLGNQSNYETDVCNLDDRLTSGEAVQADHEALSYLSDVDLTLTGATAADVVALVADVFRSY